MSSVPRTYNTGLVGPGPDHPTTVEYYIPQYQVVVGALEEEEEEKETGPTKV